MGGVDKAGMARIEEQIRAEAGDSWALNEQVVRGRNAVRAEHGLAPLGAPLGAPSQGPARGTVPTKRSLWRRLLGE